MAEWTSSNIYITEEGQRIINQVSYGCGKLQITDVYSSSQYGDDGISQATDLTMRMQKLSDPIFSKAPSDETSFVLQAQLHNKAPVEGAITTYIEGTGGYYLRQIGIYGHLITNEGIENEDVLIFIAEPVAGTEDFIPVTTDASVVLTYAFQLNLFKDVGNKITVKVSMDNAGMVSNVTYQEDKDKNFTNPVFNGVMNLSEGLITANQNGDLFSCELTEYTLFNDVDNPVNDLIAALPVGVVTNGDGVKENSQLKIKVNVPRNGNYTLRFLVVDGERFDSDKCFVIYNYINGEEVTLHRVAEEELLNYSDGEDKLNIFAATVFLEEGLNIIGYKLWDSDAKTNELEAPAFVSLNVSNDVLKSISSFSVNIPAEMVNGTVANTYESKAKTLNIKDTLFTPYCGDFTNIDDGELLIFFPLYKYTRILNMNDYNAIISVLDNHEERIKDNEGTLDNHGERITNNEGILENHGTRITANENTLSNHGSKISANENKLSNHESRITANEGSIANHEDRIANNENTLSDHADRIAENEKYKIYYGSTSTGANKQTKDITIEGFPTELKAGIRIQVTFPFGNKVSNVKFKINGSGNEVPVYFPVGKSGESDAAVGDALSYNGNLVSKWSIPHRGSLIFVYSEYTTGTYGWVCCEASTVPLDNSVSYEKLADDLKETLDGMPKYILNDTEAIHPEGYGFSAGKDSGVAEVNGYESTDYQMLSGGAIGYGAKSLSGGAVGKDAFVNGGGAVGESALTNCGGAIGLESFSTDGGALGRKAITTDGGAVGWGAYSIYGGAVGKGAYSTNGGGAMGYNAAAGNGFSGGSNAKVKNNGTTASPNYIDAIQLGTGTNNNEKTLQIYSYQLLDRNGNVPRERVQNSFDISFSESLDLMEAGSNIMSGNNLLPLLLIDLDCASLNGLSLYTRRVKSSYPTHLDFSKYQTSQIQEVTFSGDSATYKSLSSSNFISTGITTSGVLQGNCGSNYLINDAGFIGEVKEGFTILFSLKCPNSITGEIFSLGNGRRVWVERHGYGIRFVGYGGTGGNTSYIFPSNTSDYIKVPDSYNYHHYAFVFDRENGEGTWYLDGKKVNVTTHSVEQFSMLSGAMVRFMEGNKNGCEFSLQYFKIMAGCLTNNEVQYFYDFKKNIEYNDTAGIPFSQFIKRLDRFNTVYRNDEGGFSAGSAYSSGGVALGNDTFTFNGGALGRVATSRNGGAIGFAATTGHGGAVGWQAYSIEGGAIGMESSTNHGGAVGIQTDSIDGFAGGYGAITTNGGAVGRHAYSGNGFSGGFNAVVGMTEDADGNSIFIDAIQLGTGINPDEHTLQVYQYRLLDANGKIPYERLSDRVKISCICAPYDDELLEYDEGWGEALITLGEGLELSGVRESIILGSQNIAKDTTNTIIMGSHTNLNYNSQALVIGYGNKALSSAQTFAVVGNNNTLDTEYDCILAVGNHNEVLGSDAFVSGSYNAAYDLNTVCGRGATKDFSNNKGYASGIYGKAFTVGIGTDEARKDGFYVTYKGDAYASGAMRGNGADVAEFYEWADGNPNGEDRVGHLVVVDVDGKVRFANENDDIDNPSFLRRLGVVSGRPGLVANDEPEHWKGAYLTDIYDRLITEHKVYEAVYDEDGNIVQEAYEADEFVLNPDYDSSRPYVSRENRDEWDCISRHGQLTIIDDGTCEVGGYCKPTKRGIATSSDSGLFVMKRLDDKHIFVLI